jgi:hypothetical protein
MDRRLAAIAGGVLAAAGALGMFGRRHAAVSIDPAPVEQDTPLAGTADAEPEVHYIATGWTSEAPFDLGQAPVSSGASAPLPSPFFQVPLPESEPVRPLADTLYDLMSGYSMDAEKLLNLRIALRSLGQAIESGMLEEGAVVVDFDWHAAPGLMMNLAVAVLATAGFVRIDVCDLEGSLRAPELNVHIRGNDVQVMQDRTAQNVDLEERRSEALVTTLKIKAIADGVAIHPGSASGVLARCRVSGSPFA